MSNQTIYINSENEEQFQAEPNKSGLVNKLLTGYYRGHEMRTTVEAIDSGKFVQDVIGKIAKAQTCPSGHMLNKIGKCSHKGCRYAR